MREQEETRRWWNVIFKTAAFPFASLYDATAWSLFVIFQRDDVRILPDAQFRPLPA